MRALIFLLSAAVLAYEVVLLRLFSVAHWHHYAAMVISIALLGFGGSGTVLALAPRWWVARARRLVPWLAAAFLVLAPAGAALAVRIPINPFQMMFHYGYAASLVAVYALLLVPFLTGALAIGLALADARVRGGVGRLYGWNLAGSGIGALVGVWLGYIAWPVPVSEFKPLGLARVMAGTQTIWSKAHPLGRVDLLESPSFRVAAGLSLNFRGTFPAQQVLFVDGDGASAVCRTDWRGDDLAYLDWLPGAVAYAVTTPDRVLVIGVGGGTDLQQALRAGAREVVGVELHPVVAAVARATLP
ncbi:hypothetical protein HQ590_06895, partial [bacterium]|nr:hypothetical protein [bacterium]